MAFQDVEAGPYEAELHWADERKSFRRVAMKPLEFICVAAFATASALGVFGIWLVVSAILRLTPATGGSLILTIAAVWHPGIWYVLAAVVVRQLGRHLSR